MEARTAGTGARTRGCALLAALGLLAGLPVLQGTGAAEELPRSASGWGLNSSGQLGDGTLTARRLAVPLPAYGPTAVLAAGDAFSVAVGTDGLVRASGNNAYGQLGDGTLTARRSPVVVAGLTGVTAAASGQHFSLAVRGDGTVAAWGRNASGQLGDGTLTTRRSPVPVAGLPGVAAVAAGDTHALAVGRDGSVWAWGSNGSGQLGDGSTTSRRTPVRVPGLTDVLAVAAGASDSFALRADGTVWAWGTNAYGQLGDGTITTRKSPVQVAGLAGVTALAAGDQFALALREDRTVLGWGRNASGQLGDGTTTTRRSPVPVAGLAGVQRIAAGDTHGLAVVASGALRAWGLNSSGQLGDGTITTRRSPVPVKAVLNAGPLAAGTAFTLTAGPPPAVGPQPDGWWAAEDLGDSAGEQPLTASGAVAPVRGAVACGFSLPRGAALTAGDVPVLEPGTSFTFSTWVSPATATGTQVVAAKGDAARSAWSLAVVDGQLRFTASADGTVQRAVTSTAAVISATGWQHVTVVYDGTLTETQRVRLHVDGVPVETEPSAALAGPPANIVDLTAPTRLGGASWAGGLDETRLYAVPLSSAEAADAHAADAAQAGTPCDRAAPVTSGSLSAPAGPGGWHTAPVDLVLDAADGDDGSGVSELGYSVARAGELREEVADGTRVVVPVTAEGATTVTASASDLVGNVEEPQSFSVRLDATAPALEPARTPAGPSGWSTGPVTVTWTCEDAVSGVASCPAPRTLREDGADQQVTGRAVDTAGNAATATVSGIDVDATAPDLTGTPADGAGSGWSRQDVQVRWSASDATSGVDEATRPGPSSVTGEGRGLTATASVADRAGNRTTAVSEPVSIDRTPPVTRTALRDGWSRGSATVRLSGEDALSGVAATSWTLDDGPVRTGTEVVVEGDGVHTLRFWSTDVAGNAQEPVEAEVLVDDRAPSITASLSAPANGAGWHDRPVDVRFTCEDAGSGIASCSGDRTVDGEGAGQLVEGEAVDRAGNRASSLVALAVDLTRPAVTADVPAAGPLGWYTAPLDVAFSCADGLSGIASCPEPVRVGEGAEQAVRGTATDVAGHRAAAGVEALSVDLSDPVLTGTPAVPRGTWSRGDVAVAWTCSDRVSGLSGPCPQDTLVTGEGVLAAAATVFDRAGRSTTTTVSGIAIDRTAPVTTAEVPEPGPSGWYDGGVSVALEAADALSGVATTTWSLDGGEPTAYDGPVRVTGDGTHELRSWSTDGAGNVEQAAIVVVRIDGTPPTLSAGAAPAAGPGGWATAPVTVRFTCSDSGSGPADCPEPVTVDREGADQAVSGTATDAAGNQATATISVSLDLTAPSVVAVPRGTRSPSGWWTTPVQVDFRCDDALSGIATCPTGVTLLDGRGQSAQGTATDRAGHSSAAALTGVDVDTVAPRLALAGPADGASYLLGERVPEVSCSAEDDGSGLAEPCTVSLQAPDDGTGTWTATAVATDRAGHTTTRRTSWSVGYAWSGWGAALGARADETGEAQVRAGSAVPVSFTLADASGSRVAAASDPVWLEPVPVGTGLGRAGTPVRLTGGAYRHTWRTTKEQAGTTWQVGVRLDDGTVHRLRVVLR